MEPIQDDQLVQRLHDLKRSVDEQGRRLAELTEATSKVIDRAVWARLIGQGHKPARRSPPEGALPGQKRTP